MNQENYVIFKGTKDGVTVLFDADAPFEELCQQLENKHDDIPACLYLRAGVYIPHDDKAAVKFNLLPVARSSASSWKRKSKKRGSFSTM